MLIEYEKPNRVDNKLNFAKPVTPGLKRNDQNPQDLLNPKRVEEAVKYTNPNKEIVKYSTLRTGQINKENEVFIPFVEEMTIFDEKKNDTAEISPVHKLVSETYGGKMIQALYPKDEKHFVAHVLTQDQLSQQVYGKSNIDAAVIEKDMTNMNRVLRGTDYSIRSAKKTIKDPKSHETISEKRVYYLDNRPALHLTIYGDVIEAKDKQGNLKTIRLSEEEFRLLWELTDDDAQHFLEDLTRSKGNRDGLIFSSTQQRVICLNEKINEISGVNNAIMLRGNGETGLFYTLPIGFENKELYKPVHQSRLDAVTLLAQFKLESEILAALGNTKNGIPHHCGNGNPAVANAVKCLFNRHEKGILLPEEKKTFELINIYMKKENLDTKDDLLDRVHALIPKSKKVERYTYNQPVKPKVDLVEQTNFRDEILLHDPRFDQNIYNIFGEIPPSFTQVTPETIRKYLGVTPEFIRELTSVEKKRKKINTRYTKAELAAFAYILKFGSDLSLHLKKEIINICDELFNNGRSKRKDKK